MYLKCALCGETKENHIPMEEMERVAEKMFGRPVKDWGAENIKMVCRDCALHIFVHHPEVIEEGKRKLKEL